MYKKQFLQILKANVGKSVSFHIGSTYMSPSSGDWYILPFLNDDLLRVVSLSNDRAHWVTDTDTTITDTGFTPNKTMTLCITHYRIDMLTSVTIRTK